MKELVTSALDVLALLAVAVGLVLFLAPVWGLGSALMLAGFLVAVTSWAWATRRHKGGAE